MNTLPYDPQFINMSSYKSPETTVGILSRTFPSTSFYIQSLLGPVLRLGLLAQLGKCDDEAWVHNSARVARLLEKVGCRFHIEGMEHIDTTQGPCVFVANHMSTLETFVLPSIIQPRKPVTFVVKQSLTSVPVFGPVMCSRNPIVVGRVNPRHDLQTVLEEGRKRLESGISIVVFPQSTRALQFNPAKFNSIGVKLAKHSKCPIVPLALHTAAWGQGKKLKDFGEISPHKTIYFRFGAPMHVEDQGKAEHAEVCRFIIESLNSWGHSTA